MRRASFIALIVGLIVAAVPAQAQERKFTAALLLGQQLNFDTTVDNDFALGLQLGWNLDEHWSVQGELSYSEPDSDRPMDATGTLLPGTVGNADVMLASVDIVHNWTRDGSRIIPFVAAGGSWLDIQHKAPAAPEMDSVGWGFNVGGGFRFEMQGGTFALAEARYHTLTDPSANVLQVMIGYGFSL